MTQVIQLVVQKNGSDQLAQVLSSIKPTKVSMEEGMKIILTESKTGQLPSNIKAKKIDNNLQIADENDNILLTLEDYYTTENIQLGTVTESGFVEFNYVNPDTGAISGVASESSYKTLVSEMISDASLIGGISNGILLGSLGAAALGIAALSSGSSDDSPKLPANKLPISKDSLITATEDTIVTGKLQAATDADGDTLSYAIATTAANGKVVIGKDGSYTYTPNANFNGKDAFTYTISDGKGGIITQTANVTISAVNDAPVSENSTIAATEDTVVKGMLAKATDADGDILTYTLGTAAANGKVVIGKDGSYTYTPNTNFNGTDSFTYIVSDGQGGLITKTANITVASVNDLPVSTNTAIKASEDTVAKGMLAKATDADGDVLSYALKDTAANGKVVVGKDGSYTYTPNANFNGKDTFTYTINDGKGGVITQTANVTIAAVNDAPVSENSTIAATEDTVAKGMLTKATDVDSDILTYTLGTAAANGKVIIGKDGSYTYTPNADFNGTDSFTYTINDGKGGVITQTATVNVAAVNDVPVSENSTITATEDTVAKGMLAKATDVDGDTLTYTLGTAAANGKVVIDKDGSYTYTPNANFNGKDTFTYTINDGKGGVITQTAAVNVAAVNDVPVSENSTIAATEDTVAKGMLTKATDVDGDTLTYTLGAATINGKVVVNADGSYSYTPNANFNGTDSFTYTVSDGKGGFITQTANITVASVNDLPVSTNTAITATEDTVAQGMLAKATDADGDALTYAIATNATNGKVVVGKDGSYTYTPNANFNGKDTFTYTISDGKGGIITQTANVTIAAVNDAPVSTDTTIVATEDTIAKGMLTKATDVDGDALTYTLGTATVNGKVVVNADGSYSYTPNANFNGTDSFTYTVSDGQGGLITKTANITVASVNDLPVSKDSIIAATEDTVVTGKLEAATDADGDALTYAIATGAANGKVVIGKDGSYTYTPNANFNGKDSFTYTINDGKGGVITQTATVNVAAVNDVPVSENSTIAATEDTVAKGMLAKATDVDGDTLTYTLGTAAANGKVVIGKDGSYTYTPNADFNGTDSFTYTINDGKGGVITQTATVNVAAVNDAPVSENSTIAATEDTVAKGMLAKATDVDGDTLTYTLGAAAANGKIIIGKDGSYTYTPNADFNGTDSFTYTINDGKGGVITQTATVNVAAVNDVPVSENSTITATEDTVVKGMLAKATDVDGDILTYTLGTAAANGKVVIGKDGSYTYTPNTNFNGTDSFTYTVSDGKGGFITQTANITVASVNDLPVSTNTAIKASEDTVAKGMLAKATDADGDVLSYALKDTAANGKVVVGKDGSYTYTPNADFNGSDSFTYTINDGKGGVITQTATVNVAAVNDVPVSENSTIAATEDTVAKGMLAKATDADGDILTYTLGTAAANGKVVIGKDGSYTYTPNADFNGTDSFTYTINDGKGGVITQTATVNVAAVNDVPVSENSTITATEDTVAKGMLAKATDVDGDTLTYTLGTAAANGKVVIGKDGSYTYTPNADFNGSDSFTYTISDGKGGETIKTANVTIGAVNDAPVSTNTTIAATEDKVAKGMLAKATDVDGDALTYTLGTATVNGKVVVNADGSYSYTPNANFNGTDSFTYTVNDGQGGLITQTANITVASVNDLPVSKNTNITAIEDTVAKGMLAKASDADGDTLSYALKDTAANGKVVISKDGSYTYTPNADFNGSDSFTYTISDGKGGETIKTANVTIAAVNDAPVSENSAIGVAENIIDTGVLAKATDVDGDTLTYALLTEAANGTVTVNANGSYTYTPDTDFKGEDSFTYTVNDGQGGIITKTANVKVSSLDQKSSFELQEVFETNVVMEQQAVVEKQASSYINEVIEFEITGQNGMPQLALTNGSNIIQGNYSYTLQGPGISASTSGSISSAGSNSYLVDFRTGTLPPGKYTLDLYVYSSGSSIDFKVTESKYVEYTEFTGYQDVTGNIFADESGTISTPKNYEIQVDGQSLVFQTGNPAASPITVNTNNGKLALAADGSYSYHSNRTDLGLDAEKLAEDLYVKVIDLDSKQVGHYGINITSDTTPPQPGVLVLNNFDDTGLSQEDRITYDNAFDLVVEGNEPGSQVELQYSMDNGVTWQVLANGMASNLVDGDYSFRAKVIDEALNESFTAVKDITIDTTAPILGDILNFNTATNQLEVNADIDQDTLQAFKSENGILLPITDASNIPFAEGSYQIKASDLAGNSSILDFTMANASGEYRPSIDGIDIVKGSAGDDRIYGGNGDDILISSGGRDVLNGEAGDDTLILGPNSSGISTTFMSGGEGNDTYVIGATELSGSGYGVTILDYFGSNILKLKDINASDVVLTRIDTKLELSIEGKKITIDNQFGKGLFGTNSIDNITFDDGTVWDKATIEALTGGKVVGTDGDDILTLDSENSVLYGGDGNDTLKGGPNDDFIYGGNGDDILISSGGRDVLNGEAGDDTLILGPNSSGISTTFMSGGEGNDTYVIGATELSGSGYGVTILDYFGSNILKLKDINASDVVLTRIDTKLELSIEGKKITIDNQFGKGLFGTNSIDNITFDDGTVWDKATIEAMADGGDSSGRSVMSFNEAEEFNTEIDIFANSQQVELPSINDLFDLSSNELAFESADVVGANTANETATTSVFSGASEPSTAVDLTIGQLQMLNDNMQTEAMFPIM